MFELDDLSVGLSSSQTEPSTTIDYNEVNDDEDNDDEDNDDDSYDDEDDDEDVITTSYQDPSIGYYDNHHRRFFEHIHQQRQQRRVVYLLGRAHVVNHHPTSTAAVSSSSSSSSASSAAMSNAIIELVQNYQQGLYWFTYRSELIVPLRPYNSLLHAPHSFAWNASHYAVYSSPFAASNATTNINDDDAIAAVPIETNDNNLGGTGGMKTDAGWGCMLRSAQMLLAETVRRHYSSSESDYNDNDDDDDNNNIKEKDEKKKKKNSKSSRMEEERIARWFADFPNHAPNHSSTFAAAATTTAANEGNEYNDDISNCGGIDNHWYSLHSMVAAGLGLGMLPGEWYGPNMVCHVLSELNAIHCASREELLLLLSHRKKMNNYNVNDNVKNNETVNKDNTTSASLLNSCDVFRIHVANGGTVYVDAITKLMTSSSTTFQRHQQQSQGGDDGIGQVNDEKCEPPLPIDEFDDPLRSTTIIPQNKFIDEDDDEYDDGGIEWDTSLLLLLPLRLGINSISTSDYGSTLSKLMSFPHSVGMLGGTPRHALWFYGADAIDGGNNDHQDYDGGWYGLDPHIVQLAPRGVRVSNAGTTRSSSAAAPTWEDVCNDMESVEETQPPPPTTTTTTTTIPTTATSIPTYRWQVQLTNSYLTSLHTSPTGVTHPNHKRAIPLSKLDPSCALGFYIRNRDDFIHLRQLIRKLGTDELQRQNKLPDVITVMTRTPRYELDDCSAGVLNDSVDCGLDGFAMSSDDVEREEENDKDDDDDDDFVLI